MLKIFQRKKKSSLGNKDLGAKGSAGAQCGPGTRVSRGSLTQRHLDTKHVVRRHFILRQRITLQGAENQALGPVCTRGRVLLGRQAKHCVGPSELHKPSGGSGRKEALGRRHLHPGGSPGFPAGSLGRAVLGSSWGRLTRGDSPHLFPQATGRRALRLTGPHFQARSRECLQQQLGFPGPRQNQRQRPFQGREASPGSEMEGQGEGALGRSGRTAPPGTGLWGQTAPLHT